MESHESPQRGNDALLKELEGIRDVYQLDVKQFVAFMCERKLLVVDGFKQYARWLEEEHAGKRYSPSTINRKLAARAQSGSLRLQAQRVRGQPEAQIPGRGRAEVGEA